MTKTWITWQKEDDELLLKLKNKGLSYIEIKEIFKKYSQDAIRSRFCILNQQKKNWLINTEIEQPKVLLLDIETSTLTVHTWNLKVDYINPENIISDYVILSWSAKWLGNEEMFSDVLTSGEAKKKNDKRICKSLWKLIDEADILIGHNSISFDEKKIYTRFLTNKLPPPRPHKSLDTVRIARNQFGFSSNKLDFLCRQLEIPHKSESGGLENWLKAEAGDKEALEIMQSYNKNDVVILEALFNELSPWIKILPSKPKVGWK
jgi:hypothetical protein